MQDENRPTDPFEAASYDLNKFRERRVADRRFQQRDTPDRRRAQAGVPPLPPDDALNNAQSRN